MTVIQILLLIAGAVIFALGFFIPEGRDNSSGLTVKGRRDYRDKIKEITDNELKDAARRVRDIVDEEVALAHDNSARSLEKLTNEKIMAINEYGKTVTDEIERNHKEVVFMYDMLNNKSTDLKNTIRKAENVGKNAVNNATAAQPAPAAKKDNRTGLEKAAVKNQRAGASAKADSAENIHIPKMFAAPKDKNWKAEVSGMTKDEKPADLVTGIYGQDVLRLHKEGVPDIDIAKRLGIGVGEVRLAISLNGAGGTNEA